MLESQRTICFINFHVAMAVAWKLPMALPEPMDPLQYYVPAAWEGLQETLRCVLGGPA